MVPCRLGNRWDAGVVGGGDGGVHNEVDCPRKHDEMAHLVPFTLLRGVEGIQSVLWYDSSAFENVARGGGIVSSREILEERFGFGGGQHRDLSGSCDFGGS